MPTPISGESHDHFMSRCIPILRGEGKDQDQAVAVCQSFWENKKSNSMGPIIYKNFAPVIKDVDAKKGIVEGYFSTWGIVDAHDDEIVSGAYKKTLQENGPGANVQRIHHLWGHDSMKPLHRFTISGTLLEDPTGLFFISKISKTSYGKDLLLLYEDEVVNEHSVGIQVVKSDTAPEGHNRILEVKLWEGSTVTWGANWDTPVTAMKSEDPTELAEMLSKRIELLTKSIRNGNYTDETFLLLELNLQQIQGHYMSLINGIQPGQSTGKKDEPREKRIDLEEFLHTLKLE